MFYLLLTVLVIIILYNKWKNRSLSKIPTPSPYWPIIGNTNVIFTDPETTWSFFQKYNRDYYPIYKTSNTMFSIVHLNDPDDIEIILSSKTHIRKGQVYEWMQEWLGTGLLTSDGNKWHCRRKLLTPTFHFNILQQFSKIFVEHSEQLVEQLEKECNKPYTNITPIITQFTLHTICETAMGTKLNEKKKENMDFVSATHRMSQLLTTRLKRPWLFISFIYFLSQFRREQTYILNILHSFSKSVIENRKEHFKESDVITVDTLDQNFQPKRRLAMLDLLLSLKQQGVDISDEGIREEVDTFIFEGHDTTSAGISFALLLIANHPDVQEKIVQEINDVMGESDRQFTFSDIQQLHYLEMVIKEAQRLFPSVPLVGRRVMSDVKTAAGYIIPKDTLVTIHIYGLHHNPRFYPDPEKFDPYRFLPENTKGRHPFSYIPFSAGPRNCIGQKFAMLELKTALASVIHNYILTPVSKPADIKLIMHLILKTNTDIRIKFKKRK